MSGFFSLESGAVTNLSQQDPSESSTSWLLYSTATTTKTTSHHHHNRPTATKAFELWQHHLPHAHNLLAAGPANSNSMGGGGTGDGRFINFADESTWGSAGFVMMGGGGGGGGGMSCQDCGNQAKKDCPHIRCRTCCKSRGFQCPTHVKSTWVPAAKRRERQQHHSGGQEEDDNRRHLVQNNIKRTRSVQDPGNPNLVNPNSTATAVATGFDHAGNFPPELATPADFRCVRVSSIDETEDQIAYQAAVNIGGHLFKGILYDQGPEDHYMGGDTSSGGSGGNPQLNRTAISPGSSTAAAANFSGHSLYSSLGGNDYMMTSTQFFHPISRD